MSRIITIEIDDVTEEMLIETAERLHVPLEDFLKLHVLDHTDNYLDQVVINCDDELTTGMYTYPDWATAVKAARGALRKWHEVEIAFWKDSEKWVETFTRENIDQLAEIQEVPGA